MAGKYCWGRMIGALFLFWGSLVLPSQMLSATALQQDSPAGSTKALNAGTAGQPEAAVLVGTILHNPPYVLENPSAGIDLDIIRAAFASKGREVKFTHAPISRVEFLLAERRIDAMTTFRTSEDQCFNSAPFSQWHDGISVRRDLAGQIQSIEDLRGRRVGLFPGAERVLAPIIGDHVRTFERRVTIYRTPLVVRMLRYGRIDAYIGDYWALEHAARQGTDAGEAIPFTTVVAFAPTTRRLCFTDDSLRQIFDAGVSHIRARNQLERIQNSYRQAPAAHP